MGHVLQVDPELVTAGARRLAVAAGTLDTLATRLAVLGGCAGAAAGAPTLARSVEETGRELGRALAHGADAVSQLATLTDRAGADYRSTELGQVGSWSSSGGPGGA